MIFHKKLIQGLLKWITLAQTEWKFGKYFTHMAKKPALSRKEQVELTALQLIKTHGIQGASMADISAGSGVAVGTIYHHFESREALIDALRLQMAEQLAQALSAGLAGKGSHKDKVQGLWNNAYAFFAKNPLAASFMEISNSWGWPR